MPGYFCLLLRTVSVSWLCLCYCISSFFFSGEKRKEAKKKRHFWQTAPQPKGALLRVLVARVILFVCAGATAPHVLAPLFVFFLSGGIFTVSPRCFCFFFLSVGACTPSVSLFRLLLRTVTLASYYSSIL